MDASSYLVTLFLAYTSLFTFCEGLYCTYQPQVTLSVGQKNDDAAIRTTVVGQYAEYGSSQTRVKSVRFVLIPDVEFGCDSDNLNTSAIVSKVADAEGPFVLAIPLDAEECSDYTKALAAYRIHAAGVLFYYLPNSPSSSRAITDGDNVPRPLSIPIAAIELPESTLNGILEQQKRNYGFISMIGYCYPSIQSSQTFYFVVFTFCILTVLSCLWFLLSYIRRCRLRAQRRRRRVRACVCVLCMSVIMKGVIIDSFFIDD